MFSRIVLILTLALIPFVDWVLQFPETQPDLRLIGDMQRVAARRYDAPEPKWGEAVGTPLRPTGLYEREHRIGYVPLSRGRTGPLVNADTAAEKALSHGAEPVGPSVYFQPTPAAVRTTSDRSGIRGIVTWVHPSLAGGLMRDGVTRYDPSASGLVAANSWPIGTVLEVRGPTGRSMMLEVRDTGLLGPNHLDASSADFRVLVGDLNIGVARIEIRELP